MSNVTKPRFSPYYNNQVHTRRNKFRFQSCHFYVIKLSQEQYIMQLMHVLNSEQNIRVLGKTDKWSFACAIQFTFVKRKDSISSAFALYLFYIHLFNQMH